MSGYEPTHVVAAITYGADAHIVFTHVSVVLHCFTFKYFIEINIILILE